ncbi:WXG100 family type VII secretion target [Kitasatospora brasiliensis]|uniref:WXG100 family type VII secretion target n=1 Tax=Kitasatospora brasiliensis TaxID=3058040 RepID=UPI0029301E66|nr:hypothetical protein [Kitasatospora sp. K002]
MEHAHLRKMVDKTDPTTVLSRGTQLQSAGRVLKELSAALKSHVGNVAWEGPAAENFKTWVNNLQQSAEIIGDHAATAGGAMHQAGEALSTAKVAVPEPPATEIQKVDSYNQQPKSVNVPAYVIGQTPDEYMKSIPPHNWVTSAEYATAKAKVDKEHQEAVLQMEKLAQAYSAATTTLNGIPADVVLPGTPGRNSSRSDLSDASGGTGGSVGSGGPIRSPRMNVGNTGGNVRPPGGGNHSGGQVLPHDPGSGGPVPSNPGTTPPPWHGGGGQLPPPPQDPGVPTPPSHPSDPGSRPGTGLDSVPTLPTLPSQTGPYGPGGGQLPPDGTTSLPGYPGGPNGPGGGPGIPGGGPIPGVPTGPGGGTIPARGGSGGLVPGKGGGQIPARTTPFGGGPQGRSGSQGLPSGTVFGAREAAGSGGGRVGGPGMGGMHPGMGGAHGGAVGAGGGSRGGRGLTSTTGGTIGGRKGPTSGGEFTPGGTGLRNRAAGAAEGGGAQSRQNGMMAPGAAGHGGRNEKDRRKRADYLHEDEETWTSGTPHSNPDVIE